MTHFFNTRLWEFEFFIILKSNQAEEDEKKRGVRISQGKPFLKRGPSQHSSQGSFRRRSIRLKKSEERQNSVASSSTTGKWSGIVGGSAKHQEADTECKFRPI